MKAINLKKTTNNNISVASAMAPNYRQILKMSIFYNK